MPLLGALRLERKIKTVFFDVGNTLLFPNRARIHAPLVARNLGPDDEHLLELECRIKNKFDGMMVANGSTDHSFWWMFYSQLLAEIGVVDEALLLQLVASIRNSANWDTIRPHTSDLLCEIGEHYEIAVISNADGKIKEVLKKCGIDHCFRTITDSGLIGFEKPHPEIFSKALIAMNVDAESSLYVGDVYSVDYLGATRAGMQAILMDVPRAYRDRGVPRVETLEQLRDKLCTSI